MHCRNIGLLLRDENSPNGVKVSWINAVYERRGKVKYYIPAFLIIKIM